MNLLERLTANNARLIFKSSNYEEIRKYTKYGIHCIVFQNTEFFIAFTAIKITLIL
jgi:hypothetical protein